MISQYILLISLVCSSNAIYYTLPVPPIVIIISMDGFRYDYLSKVPTPNFQYLIDGGVTLPYMKNAFQTKTFPNHQTLATGLWTESHGIIDNRVFDPEFGREISIANEEFYRFHDEVIPLWIRNEMGGGGRKSGVIMWPGSEHGFGPNSLKPSRTMPYDETVTFQTRIDQGLSWIKSTTDPINLLMMYFHEPDASGHEFGPESDPVKKMIASQDLVVNHLIKKLNETNLLYKADVIILSDHGMQEVKRAGIIDIPMEIQDMFDVASVKGSPNWNIKIKDGQLEDAYGKLKELSQSTGSFKVFKKEEIPEEWHMGKNRRIQDILMVANLGFVFTDYTIQEGQTVGVHGYSNNDPNMWPFFIAHGPSFKKGYRGKSINNVDVFPLVSNILEIPIAPNNGTLDNTAELRRTKPVG